MCGRYRRRSSKQRIAEEFHVDTDLDEVDFAPDSNASPGTFQPVITADDDGHRKFQSMYWGFKLPAQFTVSARSDNLASSSLWKTALRLQRCIIPADSVFEWTRLYNDTKKNPKYEISVRGQEMFGIAGIWRPWLNERTGKLEPTIAVITTDPSEEWLKMHDRQTAILDPSEYEQWLALSDRPPLHFLRTFPGEKLTIERIGGAAEQLSLI
jgi:putative SOS response-associated peptidase YedK